MPLRAGDLRERVTLQSSASTRDPYGEETEAWTDGVTAWASVRAEKPSERLRAGRLEGQTAYIVTLRYPLPGGVLLTTASRLRWETAPGGPRTLALTGVTTTREAVQAIALDL